jgi:hypothetical protein
MFGAYAFGQGYFGQAPPGLVTRVAIGLAHGSSTALAVSLRLLDTATVSAARAARFRICRVCPVVRRSSGRCGVARGSIIETGDWRY